MPQSNKLSNLNSVLYTPVLQWFGLDVKKQGKTMHLAYFCHSNHTARKLETIDISGLLTVELQKPLKIVRVQ